MRWIVLVLLALCGCRRSGPAQAPPAPGAQAVEQHADEKQHEEMPKLVKLSPHVVDEARIKSAPAEKRRLAATIDLNGQVIADQDHIALLAARAEGRVLKVLVREGDVVNRGQSVAVVSSPQLAKRRAEHAAAGAKAAAARTNALRLRSLVEQRLGADQDALVAAADAAGIEAERDASAQAIRAMGASLVFEGDASLLPIVSPIDGQVVQRDAVPGQVVEPNHTLLVIADLSRVWFQAQLFEKDLAHLTEGASAEVRLNGYPDKVFKAKVARVAAQVDPQARTLTARLAMENADGQLKLGLFGTARISLSEDAGEEHVVVPLSGVTDIGERKVIFVRHPDGDFERHDVTLGPTAGGFVAVLSGLNPGEQVVVSGVHTLKSAVLKSTMTESE